MGDFGLSKLIKVQNSHDVYKMTGETGSCEFFLAGFNTLLLGSIEIFCRPVYGP